jgi:hypothetical protein
MKLTDIQSSNIARAGFDADSGVMEIEFHNGTRGRYRGVTPEKFDAFMSAESKGRFLSAEIKGQYEYERVEAEESSDGE